MRTHSLIFGAVLAFAGGATLAEEAPRPVKLMTVETQAPRLSRQFFGQVAARRSVDLAFQVPGQIMDFPVVEGFVTPKGEMIAQLDLEPFQLQLDQARLQDEQAERTVARFNKLQGTVSQVSIDDAETQAGLARIALRNAEYELEHATLYAPFDALVSSRNVEAFSTVASGTPIVRIHDMSELHIEVDIPEILFQRAGEDPNAQIFVEFSGKEGKYPLSVLEFDAEASTVGQTFAVTFLLVPPEGLSVFPGSSVRVTVTADLGRAGIVLPATALVIDPGGQTGVMVFSPTGADFGTVTWNAVEIEPTQSGEFLVLDGLDHGQEVVLTGGSMLDNGQVVRRFTGFAN